MKCQTSKSSGTRAKESVSLDKGKESSVFVDGLYEEPKGDNSVMYNPGLSMTSYPPNWDASSMRKDKSMIRTFPVQENHIMSEGTNVFSAQYPLSSRSQSQNQACDNRFLNNKLKDFRSETTHLMHYSKALYGIQNELLNRDALMRSQMREAKYAARPVQTGINQTSHVNGFVPYEFQYKAASINNPTSGNINRFTGYENSVQGFCNNITLGSRNDKLYNDKGSFVQRLRADEHPGYITLPHNSCYTTTKDRQIYSIDKRLLHNELELNRNVNTLHCTNSQRKTSAHFSNSFSAEEYFQPSQHMIKHGILHKKAIEQIADMKQGNKRNIEGSVVSAEMCGGNSTYSINTRNTLTGNFIPQCKSKFDGSILYQKDNDFDICIKQNSEKVTGRTMPIMDRLASCKNQTVPVISRVMCDELRQRQLSPKRRMLNKFKDEEKISDRKNEEDNRIEPSNIITDKGRTAFMSSKSYTESKQPCHVARQPLNNDLGLGQQIGFADSKTQCATEQQILHKDISHESKSPCEESQELNVHTAHIILGEKSNGEGNKESSVTTCGKLDKDVSKTAKHLDDGNTESSVTTSGKLDEDVTNTSTILDDENKESSITPCGKLDRNVDNTPTTPDDGIKKSSVTPCEKLNPDVDNSQHNKEVGYATDALSNVLSDLPVAKTIKEDTDTNLISSTIYNCSASTVDKQDLTETNTRIASSNPEYGNKEIVVIETYSDNNAGTILLNGDDTSLANHYDRNNTIVGKETDICLSQPVNNSATESGIIVIANEKIPSIIVTNEDKGITILVNEATSEFDERKRNVTNTDISKCNVIMESDESVSEPFSSGFDESTCNVSSECYTKIQSPLFESDKIKNCFVRSGDDQHDTEISKQREDISINSNDKLHAFSYAIQHDESNHGNTVMAFTGTTKSELDNGHVLKVSTENQSYLPNDTCDFVLPNKEKQLRINTNERNNDGNRNSQENDVTKNVSFDGISQERTLPLMHTIQENTLQTEILNLSNNVHIGEESFYDSIETQQASLYLTCSENDDMCPNEVNQEKIDIISNEGCSEHYQLPVSDSMMFGSCDVSSNAEPNTSTLEDNILQHLHKTIDIVSRTPPQSVDSIDITHIKKTLDCLSHRIESAPINEHPLAQSRNVIWDILQLCGSCMILSQVALDRIRSCVGKTDKTQLGFYPDVFIETLTILFKQANIASSMASNISEDLFFEYSKMDVDLDTSGTLKTNEHDTDSLEPNDMNHESDHNNIKGLCDTNTTSANIDVNTASVNIDTNTTSEIDDTYAASGKCDADTSYEHSKHENNETVSDNIDANSGKKKTHIAHCRSHHASGSKELDDRFQKVGIVDSVQHKTQNCSRNQEVDKKYTKVVDGSIRDNCRQTKISMTTADEKLDDARTTSENQAEINNSVSTENDCLIRPPEHKITNRMQKALSKDKRMDSKYKWQARLCSTTGTKIKISNANKFKYRNEYLKYKRKHKFKRITTQSVRQSSHREGDNRDSYHDVISSRSNISNSKSCRKLRQDLNDLRLKDYLHRIKLPSSIVLNYDEASRFCCHVVLTRTPNDRVQLNTKRHLNRSVSDSDLAKSSKNRDKRETNYLSPTATSDPNNDNLVCSKTGDKMTSQCKSNIRSQTSHEGMTHDLSNEKIQNFPPETLTVQTTVPVAIPLDHENEHEQMISKTEDNKYIESLSEPMNKAPTCYDSYHHNNDVTITSYNTKQHRRQYEHVVKNRINKERDKTDIDHKTDDIAHCKNTNKEQRGECSEKNCMAETSPAKSDDKLIKTLSGEKGDQTKMAERASISKHKLIAEKNKENGNHRLYSSLDPFAKPKKRSQVKLSFEEEISMLDKSDVNYRSKEKKFKYCSNVAQNIRSSFENNRNGRSRNASVDIKASPEKISRNSPCNHGENMTPLVNSSDKNMDDATHREKDNVHVLFVNKNKSNDVKVTCSSKIRLEKQYRSRKIMKDISCLRQTYVARENDKISQDKSRKNDSLNSQLSNHPTFLKEVVSGLKQKLSGYSSMKCEVNRKPEFCSCPSEGNDQQIVKMEQSFVTEQGVADVSSCGSSEDKPITHTFSVSERSEKELSFRTISDNKTKSFSPGDKRKSFSADTQKMCKNADKKFYTNKSDIKDNSVNRNKSKIPNRGNEKQTTHFKTERQDIMSAAQDSTNSMKVLDHIKGRKSFTTETCLKGKTSKECNTILKYEKIRRNDSECNTSLKDDKSQKNVRDCNTSLKDGKSPRCDRDDNTSRKDDKSQKNIIECNTSLKDNKSQKNIRECNTSLQDDKSPRCDREDNTSLKDDKSPRCDREDNKILRDDKGCTQRIRNNKSSNNEKDNKTFTENGLDTANPQKHKKPTSDTINVKNPSRNTGCKLQHSKNISNTKNAERVKDKLKFKDDDVSTGTFKPTAIALNTTKLSRNTHTTGDNISGTKTTTDSTHIKGFKDNDFTKKYISSESNSMDTKLNNKRQTKEDDENQTNENKRNSLDGKDTNETNLSSECLNQNLYTHTSEQKIKMRVNNSTENSTIQTELKKEKSELDIVSSSIDTIADVEEETSECTKWSKLSDIYNMAPIESSDEDDDALQDDIIITHPVCSPLHCYADSGDDLPSLSSPIKRKCRRQRYKSEMDNRDDLKTFIEMQKVLQDLEPASLSTKTSYSGSDDDDAKTVTDFSYLSEPKVVPKVKKRWARMTITNRKPQIYSPEEYLSAVKGEPHNGKTRTYPNVKHHATGQIVETPNAKRTTGEKIDASTNKSVDASYEPIHKSHEQYSNGEMIRTEKVVPTPEQCSDHSCGSKTCEHCVLKEAEVYGFSIDTKSSFDQDEKHRTKRKMVDLQSEFDDPETEIIPPCKKRGLSCVKECFAVLDKVYNHELSEPFRHEVRSKDVPDYYKIIKRGMCYDMIAHKLRNGFYHQLADFVDDMRLVFSNCFQYHMIDHEIYTTGCEMQKLFEKKLKETFPGNPF